MSDSRSDLERDACRQPNNHAGLPRTIAGVGQAQNIDGRAPLRPRLHWFTEEGGNRIGKIMTAGAITEFSASSLMSRVIGGFSLVRGT